MHFVHNTKHSNMKGTYSKVLVKVEKGEQIADICLAKGERIADICRNITFAHSSICTIHDNADRIKGSAKSENKVFVQQDYHSPIGMNCMKNY